MTDRDKLTAELARLKRKLLELDVAESRDVHVRTNLADRAFNISLHLLIAEVGPVSISQAANETAFDLGVSPVTAARYLEKHLTRRAHFRIDHHNGMIECRDCSIGMVDADQPADELTVRRRRRANGTAKIRREILDRIS